MTRLPRLRQGRSAPGPVRILHIVQHAEAAAIVVDAITGAAVADMAVYLAGVCPRISLATIPRPAQSPGPRCWPGHRHPRLWSMSTPEELQAWCASRLACFKMPQCVRLRDALPKTPTQRVEKYKLREEYARGV